MSNFFTYIIIGGTAFLVDLMIFWYAIKGGCDYHLALVFGFCIGVLINFLLCMRFLFTLQPQQSLLIACAKHYGASLIGLGLNQVGMTLFLLYFHGMHIVLARIIVSACTFTCNFFLIKYMVFIQPK